MIEELSVNASGFFDKLRKVKKLNQIKPFTI